MARARVRESYLVSLEHIVAVGRHYQDLAWSDAHATDKGGDGKRDA